MKHLKKYEAIEYKSLYKINDYIVIDPIYFKNKKSRLGQIIEINSDKVPYLILLSSGDDLWIRPDMITRMMSDEEIEQYKIELSSNKYNL